MKRRIFVSMLIYIAFIGSYGQDWNGIPVPADPGTGYKWELQASVSDDFNYDAPAASKGVTFNEKWDDFYHNSWTGPGLTIWDREHSLVAEGLLQIPASRVEGTDKVNTGCITSRERVIYPVYVEAKVKIMNSVLASDVWMLSPDDTQEIDICEAYGSSYSEGAQKDQTWFAERIHISHHVFIRNPFQDYQPTDPGSWYYNGTLWRNAYHRCGVYWKDPWNLEYYIDGYLVRSVSGEEIIDPKGYTNGTGLNKEMDIIINTEDQNWRSDQGITPTDSELANTENNTFKVDWIRVYKPVVLTSSMMKDFESRLHVFPNPGDGNISINSDEEIESIVLFSLTGSMVFSKRYESGVKRVHLEDLKPGMYLARLQVVNGTEFSQKLVVK